MVDHILKVCGQASIVNFIAENYEHEANGPPAHKRDGAVLYLAPASELGVEMKTRQVFKSGRVGLTLKKVREGAQVFIMKSYRFFLYPNLMKKGKVYAICALHHVYGFDEAKIQQLTGSPRNTVSNYVADFQRGKKGSADSFVGKNLSSADLCKLNGAVSQYIPKEKH